MSALDFYKILGVKNDFSDIELKKQFRELAKKHHPDANKGSKKSEERFKKINLAYETLKNDSKRREYDRKRASRGNQQRNGTPRGRSGGFRRRRNQGYGFNNYQSTRQEDPFQNENFQDDFVPDPDLPERGLDLHFMVTVPFSTVALGGKIKYDYEKYVVCEDCLGSGKDSGEDCSTCEGKRQVVASASADIRIPPGVADQYTLRIDHKGSEGKNGGPPGDLLIKVCIENHPSFKRIKDDIYAEVKVSSKLAESGGALEIETLESVQTIFLEEDTLTGEEYRIPGKGAAMMWGKKRGDFIAKFLVTDE